MTKTLNTTGWERCNICGVVVWNSKMHLDFSHPKKKKACEMCGQSGTGLVSITSTPGLYTVAKCDACQGTGYIELQERV